MSTQTLSPDMVSSILLAIWRMHPSKPQKVLQHLVNPSQDYHYLDAFATLCSLVPQCESASAAIGLGTESIHLYIATSPPVSQTPLRSAMATWIRLMQQIPAIGSSSVAQTDHKPAPGSLNNTTPVGNLITNIYRSCHAKLFDAVTNYDQATKLLADVSSTQDVDVEYLGLDDSRRASLVDSLTVLIGMAEHDLETSSIEDIHKLHDAARTAGKFKVRFPDAEFLPVADRLSEAVDCIVKFATSNDGHETLKLLQDVHWIETSSSPDVIATVNANDFLKFPHGNELLMTFPYELTRPPKGLSPVAGSPGHFNTKIVMHCESALLQYILRNNLSVYPYIGVSQPVCYACLMLVRAFNATFRAQKKRFAVGRRCASMTGGIESDPTWMPPDSEMCPQLYKNLISSLRDDFKVLAVKVSNDNARMMR